MLKIVLFVLMILTCSRGVSTQTTSPTCLVQAASDIRGPPGVPGSKGEPGNGKFIETTNA